MVMNPKQLRETGNWIEELRRILGQGAGANRPRGERPAKVHRSTNSAADLLMSRLREGVNERLPDGLTSPDAIRKVIFNAVDQLVDDKVLSSIKRKQKLEVIAKFDEVIKKKFEEQAGKSDSINPEWHEKIKDALHGLRAEEQENARREILSSNAGVNRMREDPRLAGNVLSGIDPVWLQTQDLDRVLGADKERLLAHAALAICNKSAPADGDGIDRGTQRDPALFSRLVAQIPAKLWNSEDPRHGMPEGFAPRACMGLWRSGGYDQLTELIAHGVDTTRAARTVSGDGTGGGIFSGYVQPLQHIVGKFLKDIDAIDNKRPLPEGVREAQVRGAKKVLDALDPEAAVVTTNWKDVVDSELLAKFKDKPGTIWGFEDLRLPYVQAAHDVDDNPQPLRMLELWDVISHSLNPKTYERLLADPQSVADECVAIGVKHIRNEIATDNQVNKAKMEHAARDPKKFIENFERDARKFLLEFAAQMPKGASIQPATDAAGQTLKKKDGADMPQVDIVGVESSKYMANLACSAGLWWAKSEGKPVYYCLDGIRIADVINYKTVKKKAIQDFIANGGMPAGAKGHDEVVTMVEMREIIKKWAQLRGTVVFVRKGKIVDQATMDAEVAVWKEKLTEADKAVGRVPAPPRAEFAHQLDELDPKLRDRLPEGPEGDMDARDLVKKASYLVRVAKTRREIVLEYLINRCTILTKYELVSPMLPLVAARLQRATQEELPDLESELLREIGNCHRDLRAPLRASLLLPRQPEAPSKGKERRHDVPANR